MIGRAWVSQQRAGGVERPLDVLRGAVVRLDRAAQRDELAHLGVGEGVAGVGGPLDALGAAAGQRPDLDGLVAGPE